MCDTREFLERRTADPLDGRAAVLAITPSGHRVLERVRAARRSVVAEMLNDWPGTDRSELARLLGQLAESLAMYATSEEEEGSPSR